MTRLECALMRSPSRLRRSSRRLTGASAGRSHAWARSESRPLPFRRRARSHARKSGSRWCLRCTRGVREGYVMLRLPPFTYLVPQSLPEAVAMLAEQEPADTMLVAGGTDLYPNMKRQQYEPKRLIGLRQLRALQGLTGNARDGLTIGAGMTLTHLHQQRDIMTGYPALATAASLVSTPQLRNMGTIGGNLCVDTRCNYYNQTYWWRQAIGFCLKKDGATCWVAPGSSRCWAVSSSDTAPVLLALGAQVRLVGPYGERVIPVQQLYQDDGVAYLGKRHEEILTDIFIPPATDLHMRYYKLRRRGAFDFPILSVAIA